MGNLSALSQTIEAAQLLKELHQYIGTHHIPVTSKDDLHSQMVEIEHYLGGTTYQELSRKKRSINIWTGILALPALLFGLFLLFGRFAGYVGIDADVSGVSQMLFSGAIRYVWAVAVYAGLFVGLVLYFKKLNTQTAAETDNIIAQLKARTQTF